MRWYICPGRELGDQMSTLAGRQGHRRDSSFTGPCSRGLRAGNPEFYNSAKVRFSRDLAGTRGKEKPGPWITPIYLLVGTRCLAEVRHNPQSRGTAEFCHFSQTFFFKFLWVSLCLQDAHLMTSGVRGSFPTLVFKVIPVPDLKPEQRGCRCFFEGKSSPEGGAIQVL